MAGDGRAWIDPEVVARMMSENAPPVLVED